MAMKVILKKENDLLKKSNVLIMKLKNLLISAKPLNNTSLWERAKTKYDSARLLTNFSSIEKFAIIFIY